MIPYASPLTDYWFERGFIDIATGQPPQQPYGIINAREYLIGQQAFNVTNGSGSIGVSVYRRGYMEGYYNRFFPDSFVNSYSGDDLYFWNFGSADSQTDTQNMYTGESTPSVPTGSIDHSTQDAVTTAFAAAGLGPTTPTVTTAEIVAAFPLTNGKMNVNLPVPVPAGYGGASPSDVKTAVHNALPVEFLSSAEQGELTTTINDLVALLGRADATTTISAIQSAIAAVKSKTDALTFVGGNVNATVTNLPSEYLSVGEQTKLALASTAQQAGQAVTLPVLPSMTVGGYAAGQDPASLLKTDAAFTKLLSHNEGKFTYVPATHSLQLLLDDGVTPLGAPLVLTVDSVGDITQRK